MKLFLALSSIILLGLGLTGLFARKQFLPQAEKLWEAVNLPVFPLGRPFILPTRAAIVRWHWGTAKGLR